MSELIVPNSLKARLKNSPSGLYIFCGKEDFLKLSYLKAFRKIIADEGFYDFNYSTLDMSCTKLSELDDALSLFPVMGTHRLIEIRKLQINSLKKDDEKRIFEIFSSIPEHCIVIVYMCSDELSVDKKTFDKKIFKELDACIVNFDAQTSAQLASWVGKRFYKAEIKIHEHDLDYLVSLCDSDMFTIDNEAEKLLSYALAHSLNVITKEEIDLFVVPRGEKAVWNLTDAVFAKKKKEAMGIYVNLKEQKIDPIILLANISKQISSYIFCKEAYEKRMSGADIAAATRLQPWQAQRITANARSLSVEYLRKSLKKAFECNIKLNSAKTEKYFLFEEFLMFLIDGKAS